MCVLCQEKAKIVEKAIVRMSQARLVFLLETRGTARLFEVLPSGEAPERGSRMHPSSHL